ncbi:MAG: hypothetical protein EBZ69_10265 [Alphaproteobacteria bacterium]|nr:hypothetical protein [Alphaproteobacteria bacterium]
MNADIAFRAVAVALALVLALAPYRQQIVEAASRLYAAGQSHAGLIGRMAAVALLVAAAWGKVPLPQLPAGPVQVTVETPSAEMQTLVRPVADALRGSSPVDRALWAEVWTKAATVAAGDAVTTEVVFTDTRSLRAFTALAIDIAWRRIGQHVPGGNEPLRNAVEACYAAAVGKDEVPVTADVRGRYVALCRAVAWAGVGRD